MYFFIEGYLLYRILLFSVKPQHESAIGIHNIPSLLDHPPISLPIPPFWVNTEPLFKFPEPYSKFLLAIYFTYGNVSFHIAFAIHLTLSSPHPMSISLCLFLHCCPVNKFFRTIFLDSVYVCYNTIFIFLFLTHFTLHNILGSSTSSELTPFYG